MKNVRSVLVFLLSATILFSFSGCDSYNKRHDISILKVTEEGSAKVSDSAIVNLLKKEAKLNVDIQYNLSEDVALEKLHSKEVQLAIIPNNTDVLESHLEVRSIVSLLPRILMVIKQAGAKGENLKELLEDNLVIFESLSRMDSLFVNQLAESYEIDLSKVNSRPVKGYPLKENIDQPAVYLGLTHLHNPIVKQLLTHDWFLFSLDDEANLNHGSSVEGFILNFPSANPFVLPKTYYSGKPDKPILTIAILDILVARRDLDNELVYNIARTIIENRAQLIQMDEVYSILDTDINIDNYTFPIHHGAMNYLLRDKPSVFTRYAQSIWPFVSMVAIFAGMFASFKNRMKRRQKEKINLYYKDLLNIRKSASAKDADKEVLTKKMRRLRTRAFEELGDNRLDANESFKIFLSLYSEIQEEING